MLENTRQVLEVVSEVLPANSLLRRGRVQSLLDDAPRSGSDGEGHRWPCLGQYRQVSSIPRSIDAYRRRGICWVVTGSLRYERALVEPKDTPGVVAFYKRLADQSEVAYQASPYCRPRPRAVQS